MIALESASVVFGAGTQDERHVIDGLSLRVGAGEFVALIGSNGAGKSTLLNAIAGSVRLASGRILVDGADVTAEPEWRRARLVGRVRQDPLSGTAAEMTVLDNLAVASRKGPRRLLPALGAARARGLAARVAELGMGLETRLRENVGRLSGGQRQALTLLMATMSAPSVLLLDEHTAALDPRNAELVDALTRRLVAEGRLTALMVTHDMRRAIAEGDRLLMMHEGRVVLDVRGDEKRSLTVEGLVDRFRSAKAGAYAEDRDLLT